MLRLHFILLGRDYGDLQRATIHSMTPVIRTLQAAEDESYLTVVGLTTITRADKGEAVNQLNTAVASVGRALATAHGFEYPDQLERLDRENWLAFCRDQISGRE